MKENIKLLAEQVGIIFESSKQNRIHSIQTNTLEEFAELIVKECIKQCQQEWYDLNNTESDTLGDARAVAILVGQKNGILKAISGIKKQFGVEE